MSEDAQLRRVNLQRLCDARGYTLRDLETRLWGRYSYWRDLLHSAEKSFGEKVARRIEDRLDLPRGWLDRDEPIPALHRAAEPSGGYAPTWIFSASLYAYASTLTRAEIDRAEHVLRAHFGMPSLHEEADN